jgi:hypothetical protein
MCKTTTWHSNVKWILEVLTTMLNCVCAKQTNGSLICISLVLFTIVYKPMQFHVGVVLLGLGLKWH